MIKSAIQHINVLNLLLLGVFCISAYFYLLPAVKLKALLPHAAPGSVPPEQIAPAAVPLQPPSAAEYLIVPEQNIFHPDRKRPAATKDAQVEVKPEFLLYGTLITDTISIAYMEDRKAPRDSPGRGKRQQSVMLGKSLSNYILTEIHHDRVLMVRGEDRVEVKISSARLSRGNITQAITVIPARSENKDMMSDLEKKPVGSGLPPGVIHKEMPPELKDKVPSQLKDIFKGLTKPQKAPN